MTEQPEAKYLRELADGFDTPYDANTLRACATRIEALARALSDATQEVERQREMKLMLSEKLAEALRQRAHYQSTANALESWVCLKTHFTGDPPYVGDAGLVLALDEMKAESEARRVYAEGLKAACTDALNYMEALATHWGNADATATERLLLDQVKAALQQPMGPRLMGGSSAEESTRVDLSSSSAPPYTWRSATPAEKAAFLETLSDADRRELAGMAMSVPDRVHEIGDQKPC